MNHEAADTLLAVPTATGPSPDDGTESIPFSEDAAFVIGLAGTAIPFAGSGLDEVEHWLRLLRAHGEAGSALQALGVSETPLEGAGGSAGDSPDPRIGDPTRTVAARATRIAQNRAAEMITTVDVLLAVATVYGPVFDRILSAHGVTRAELIEQIAAGESVRQDA